jgi:hypothetical protein
MAHTDVGMVIHYENHTVAKEARDEAMRRLERARKGNGD